jgi:hypothetical protein
MYIYQLLPLQAPEKFTQIGIFGLKIYHLATVEQEQIGEGKLSIAKAL